MAKTAIKRTPRPAAAAPGRQAPAEVWSPDVLMAALRRGSHDDKVAVLKRAGILDENGNLTETYKSWGSKVSRTPNVEDLEPLR